MNTITIPSGYTKRGKKELKTFTPVTLQQVLDWVKLSDWTCPTHFWFQCPDGNARQVRRNGKIRTWKRDANRVEISFKYGLYEHFVLTTSDFEAGLLLQEVSEASPTIQDASTVPQEVK